ncbi:MAG: cation:proton antiporter [Candidatus Aminicenantes bacterium]|jgi:Kef-type K+ transport system membrane component KefB
MIPLILIFVLMLLLKTSVLFPFVNPEKGTSIALGFILIFAFLFGKQINRLKLPQITGFILAGILCGPYVLKFLNTTQVNDLQLLDGLALSLIALTAGGEMEIGRLRGQIKSITSLVFFQTVTIILGFLLFGLLGRQFFPFFANLTVLQAATTALLIGTLATATSPSSTIAIITETKSKGKYTDLVLSVAVVKDFVVILLFALFLSLSKPVYFTEQGFDIGILAQILREVGGSVVLGLVVGGGIILYLKYINREMTIFILSVAFFTYQISHNYGYHPLLICLVAGFIVENFSPHGDRFIQAIEKTSLPVYVVFFAISGASLDFDALRSSWLLALICVIWRGLLKFIGTYTGASAVREERTVRTLSWAGFISQAGVALGLAILVEETFPQWKGVFLSLVLAIIAINQIVGPILLQKLLIKVKEAGRKDLGSY